MDLKKKVVIIVVYTAICVAFGRFAGPEKVKIEKETSKIDLSKDTKDSKTSSDTNRDLHKETLITEKTFNNGSKETTTKIVEDNTLKRLVNQDTKNVDLDISKLDTKESKTVERGGSKVNISALATLDVTHPQNGFIFGASVTKEMLGPITIGVLGFTDGRAGVSLGLSF